LLGWSLARTLLAAVVLALGTDALAAIFCRWMSCVNDEEKWMKTAFAVTLLLTLGTFSQGQLVAPPSSERPSPEQIRSGIQYLSEEILKRFPDPYRIHSLAEWQAQVAEISSKADTLDEASLFVEAAKLVNMLHGGESWVAPGLPHRTSKLFSKAVPLRFWRFYDGVFIRAAVPELAGLVGARVLEIGGVPIDEAWRRLADANEATSPSMIVKRVQLYLEIPDYLRVFGLAEDANQLTLRLQFPDASTRDVVVRAIEYPDLGVVAASSRGYRTPDGWAEPSGVRRARWLARRNEAFWYEYLTANRTVFLQLNIATRDPDNPLNPKKDRYREFLDELFRFIERNDVDRLVIDLRHNGGGSAMMYQPLVHHIIRSDRINKPGHIFVLIGRMTESAPVIWAAKLESETMALFAGEPTAGPPNDYSDPNGFSREQLSVPGWDMKVFIATEFEEWSVPGDSRIAIFPDFPIELRYGDYAAGRDHVLDTVLKVDSATAKNCFISGETGQDLTDQEWNHFNRRSQLAALPNKLSK
jgi:hypothetical protein